jgi:hypothetical protein
MTSGLFLITMPSLCAGLRWVLVQKLMQEDKETKDKANKNGDRNADNGGDSSEVMVTLYRFGE